MRTEKWYQRRLEKYFMEHYAKYENNSEWFVNPSINQWKCYLPELSVKIIFTCNDNGFVTEEKEFLTMNADKLYDIIEGSCRGMDAIYEDHIINLIGEDGFTLLRKRKLLQTCGSIDGRNLYVLCETV